MANKTVAAPAVMDEMTAQGNTDCNGRTDSCRAADAASLSFATAVLYIQPIISPYFIVLCCMYTVDVLFYFFCTECQEKLLENILCPL